MIEVTIEQLCKELEDGIKARECNTASLQALIALSRRVDNENKKRKEEITKLMRLTDKKKLFGKFKLDF